jgi:hypothetical protein
VRKGKREYVAVGSTEEEVAAPVRGCVWASCGELGGGGRGDEIKRHPRNLLAPFCPFSESQIKRHPTLGRTFLGAADKGTHTHLSDGPKMAGLNRPFSKKKKRE